MIEIEEGKANEGDLELQSTFERGLPRQLKLKRRDRCVTVTLLPCFVNASLLVTTRLQLAHFHHLHFQTLFL